MVMSWPLRIAALSKGVGGPYPPPPGYLWAFVVENGSFVTENGWRVVALTRVS